MELQKAKEVVAKLAAQQKVSDYRLLQNFYINQQDRKCADLTDEENEACITVIYSYHKPKAYGYY